MTIDYIKNRVIELLPVECELYDSQLDVLVSGAVSKLKNEGVPNIIDPSSDKALDYIICVSYQVWMDMNIGLDVRATKEQYLTRVNTLRMSM